MSNTSNTLVKTVRIPLAILMILLGTWLIWSYYQQKTVPEPLDGPVSFEPLVVPNSIYEKEVSPLLSKFKQDNANALELLIVRLQEVFDNYELNVPGFSEDVTDWGSKFLVTWYTTSDWARKEPKLNSYVQEKFEKQIFSPASLQKDIAGVLLGFHEELTANINRLRSDVTEVITTNQPELIPTIGPLIPEERIQELLTESVDNAINSALGSMTVLIGTELVLVITAELMLELTGVGAWMVAGAETGAAAGTAAAPGPGTVIGTIVVAIVFAIVGGIIDYFATAEIREYLTDSIIKDIQSIETTLLYGTDNEENNNNGLVSMLDSINKAFNEAVDSELQRQLLGVEK